MSKFQIGDMVRVREDVWGMRDLGGIIGTVSANETNCDWDELYVVIEGHAPAVDGPGWFMCEDEVWAVKDE
jgi:hypothetical protein